MRTEPPVVSVARNVAVDPAANSRSKTSCQLPLPTPVQLKRKHPALYEQLREFFRQDPAARVEGSGR